jgi:hypothetical protein
MEPPLLKRVDCQWRLPLAHECTLRRPGLQV